MTTDARSPIENAVMTVINGPAGCWLAYYSDWSDWRVFHNEIDALRYSVEHQMNGVAWLTWGESPEEAVKNSRKTR